MPAEPLDILPAGIYVVGIDLNGNEFWLETPATSVQCILVFDGNHFYWADGSDGKQFNLSNLTRSQGPFDSIAGFLTGGRMVAAVNPTAEKQILVSRNNGVVFEALGVIGLPETGEGILVKPPGGDPAYLAFTSAMIYFDDGSQIQAVPFGPADNGKILTIKDDKPTLQLPAAGSVTTGVSSIGLEGVAANNTSNSAIHLVAPAFTVSNGATDIVLANVNVSVDLSNPVGLLGLDVGGEASGAWYYIYILSNGAVASAIISASPVSPNLTATGGYTHWGLASVFRNDIAGNIITFMQKGRAFWTVPVLWGNGISSSTTMSVITSGTALSTIIPPLTKSCSGIVGGSSSPNETAERSMSVASTPDPSPIGEQMIGSKELNGVLSGFRFDAGTFIDVPIFDASVPSLCWKSSSNSVAKRRIVITGYRI